MFDQEMVKLQNGRVLLQLVMDDPEVVDWFSRLNDSNSERITAAKRALKVGITAMTSALVGSTSQTVQQALERWKAEVERALSESRERIVQTITNYFGHQVVQPVREQIEQATKNAEERIKEHIERLERRVDPSNPGSWLGIVQEAVNAVEQEFDPEREQSYLWKVRRTISEFYSRDGEAAQCIKEAIKQALEPVQTRIDQIRDNVTRVIERLGGMTPEKGKAFEQAAVGDFLRKATLVTGDRCEHVGKDGRAGDWLISVFYGSSLNSRQHIGKIVVEAKDTNRSKNQTVDDLNKALLQRNADVGILIFARSDQNPYDLPFTILDDNCTKMICIWDNDGLNLNFAYQLARLQIIANHLKVTGQIDWVNLRNQVRSAIEEVERIDEIINKTRLAKERANEAETLSQEVKRNLIQKLRALERSLTR